MAEVLEPLLGGVALLLEPGVVAAAADAVPDRAADAEKSEVLELGAVARVVAPGGLDEALASHRHELVEIEGGSLTVQQASDLVGEREDDPRRGGAARW